MERFHEHREKAVKHLKTADHMVAVSYPLVKDPKLLLAVMDNIYLSLTESMAAILHFDRVFHRIPAFRETFAAQFMAFKEHSVPQHTIDDTYLHFMLDIKNVITKHKEAPVEFRRKDAFVICSKDFTLKVLTVPEIKNHIKKTKQFTKVMENIVSKHDSLFERRSR